MADDPFASDLATLASIARDGNLDMRPVLLRVRTDLFLVAPSRPRDLLDSFAALATGLIPVVPLDAVAVVARKLAPHPETPLEVIECLLGRGGEVAEIVLSLSPLLPRRSLEEVISRGTTPMVLAVARRRSLDARLTGRIIDRNEAVLDEELARNLNLTLPPGCLDALLGRARDKSALATLLAQRPDLGGAQKASLYRQADRDVRNIIIMDVARLAALDARNRARRRLDVEDAALLVAAAAEAHKPTFVTALAVLLNTSAAHATELVNEPTGELLALSLGAIGLPLADAHLVFLTLDPAIARSVERVFGLSDLMRRVKQPVAARIIDAVLGREPTPLERLSPDRATFVPAMAPSGTPSRPGQPHQQTRERERRVRATLHDG